MSIQKIKSVRLGAQEEYELIQRIQKNGDLEARNILVMANVGLVHFIVNQMLRKSFRYDDLLHEGVLGLMRAVQSYDPARNVRFSTYGAFWVRAKIQRFIQVHKPSEGSELLDKVLCEEQNPEERLLELERGQVLKRILKNMVQELKNPHAQAIVDRRLLAEEPETLECLGKRLNISRETCRLLELKMIRLAKEQLVQF